jgi:hypothetical protein
MKSACPMCRYIVQVSAIVLCVVAGALAQETEFNRWTFDVGGGVTPTLGAMNSRLGTGWNISGGGGMNFTRHLGTEFQVMYDGLGVNPSVLQEFAVPGANAHLWGFSLDPRARFRISDRLGIYVRGGPGYYRRVVNFTQPTTELITVFDPFFGFQSIPIAADQVIGTITRVGWGGNIGAGLTYKLGDSGLKFFTEISFHYADTHPTATEVLPFTFGIRW